MKVYVFIGKFKNKEEALNYTEPIWKPEPPFNASNEEWELWEETNPVFKLQSDLKCQLDPDFIETLTEGNNYEYIKSILLTPENIEDLKIQLDDVKLTVILIFQKAIESDTFKFENTNQFKYLGEFNTNLD